MRAAEQAAARQLDPGRNLPGGRDRAGGVIHKCRRAA